jgi:cation transport regulator ChaC
VAGPDNAAYFGAARLQGMAQKIAVSSGPGGAHADYLLKIDDALKSLGVVDEHVASLANGVRLLLKTLRIKA